MRVLKILVVVMGVLIIGGTATLVAIIAHRIAVPAAPVAAGAPGQSVAAAPAGAAAVPVTLRLDEPAGTRIAGMTAAGDRLAVQLQGGGADRVVLIDPRDGRVAGRISLAH